MADDRTVLPAAPEHQPDSLGIGTTSKQDLAKPIPPGAGKPSDGETAQVEEEPPAQSAPKSEWEDYAQSLGIDTDDMTKAEIIDAVEGA